MNNMKDEKKIWEEIITTTNITHNSRKAWNTIINHYNSLASSAHPCLVRANQVAHQRQMQDVYQTKVTCNTDNDWSLNIGLPPLARVMGVGRQQQQRKILVPKLRGGCLRCSIIASLRTRWNKSNIIAILKPGKDYAIPKGYRPISLLCHTYKLYERLIMNRIAPTIEEHLIKEQDVVRPEK